MKLKYHSLAHKLGEQAYGLASSTRYGWSASCPLVDVIAGILPARASWHHFATVINSIGRPAFADSNRAGHRPKVRHSPPSLSRKFFGIRECRSRNALAPRRSRPVSCADLHRSTASQGPAPVWPSHSPLLQVRIRTAENTRPGMNPAEHAQGWAGASSNTHRAFPAPMFV
jgi:hypothetical protein